MINSLAPLTEGYRYQEGRAKAWEDFAHQMMAVATAKEGVKAVLDGVNIALEHPDPIEQRKANRLIADLLRIATEIEKARGVSTKGSRDDN